MHEASLLVGDSKGGSTGTGIDTGACVGSSCWNDMLGCVVGILFDGLNFGAGSDTGISDGLNIGIGSDTGISLLSTGSGVGGDVLSSFLDGFAVGLSAENA